MICEKCGNEINEESLFCNKCGNRLVQDSSSDENLAKEQMSAMIALEENADKAQVNDEKFKKTKIKKLFIIALSVLIIVSVSFGLHKYSVNQKAIKAQQEAQTKSLEYKAKIISLEILMLDESGKFEKMCNGYVSTWRDAIDKNKSFDLAIINKRKEYESMLKQCDEKSVQIENLMKDLQNPSEEYKKAYDIILELYSSYKQFYSMASTPQGSLTSYSQDFRKVDDKFIELYNKLQILIPKDSSKQ